MRTALAPALLTAACHAGPAADRRRVDAAFEPGGTERQMIELVRRLDPRALDGPRRLLPRTRRVV